MPSGLRTFARNQPVTYMIDAVRSRLGAHEAEALLGHPASYLVVRSLIWSAFIVLVFGRSQSPATTAGDDQFRLHTEE